ncbi:MAG TPA: ATP-binding protein [Gemmatimonadaceae bacterium]|nr:ATP-binding protein [Gemmatimonadaceae bacterium]
MAAHERRLTWLVLLSALPALSLALALLWSGDFAGRTKWTLTLVVVLALLAGVIAVRERVVRPLQTISNMLAAVREQDYSLRARRADPDDALGLAMFELNALMTELRERRLGALEATTLLRRVMEEIDVAVLAFDDTGALRLVNPLGEAVLGQPAERLLGRSAEDLGLAECLEGDVPRLLDLALDTRSGRWEVRRGTFRQDGRPHRFIVLADVSRTLREEERLAWQRIIRVLGHEINNSITPINSLAERLQLLLQRAPPVGALRDDLQKGLAVIATRSQGLARFLESYTRLAKLPRPRLAPVPVRAWVQRVARLETRLPVAVDPGPDLVLSADGDQLDQLLINLVANAVDAAMATGGGVHVSWRRVDGRLELAVIDDGPGLPDSANLFVPFFSTKPGGSGIGLVLSRQIAEAHGGTVTLANRHGARGCEARLVLPLAADAGAA